MSRARSPGSYNSAHSARTAITRLAPTENPAAYDAYLRGLAYAVKSANTLDNLRGAQRHLSEAVRLDPQFALAWARLSLVRARSL